MIPSVIGLEAKEAKCKLTELGYDVHRVEYVSRRGIPDADSTRVIRQRKAGDNSIEITVSFFKTKILVD